VSGFDLIQGPGFERQLLREPAERGEGLGARPAGFGAAIADALAEVDRLGADAKSKAEALARGEPVEVHDLMIALGKSEVAFNLMLEVRNKMVEAWQTLSRSVI
jgi:flagellar hook-basal body complex protein FliE